jgi:DNA-binding CsgD family transcriptional regulator
MDMYTESLILSSLVAKTSKAMWALDCKGACIFSNLAARQLSLSFERGGNGAFHKVLLSAKEVELALVEKTAGSVRRSVRFNSDRRVFLTRFEPLCDDDGVVQGVIAETEDISELVSMEEKLWAAQTELQWQREALAETVKSIDAEKQKLREAVLHGIEEAVHPQLVLLKRRYPDETKRIGEIEERMRDSSVSAARSLLFRQYHLTPTECRILQYIKAGFLDREIQEEFEFSSSTLKKHKFSIRRKLGLENSDVPLREGLKAIPATTFL